MTRAAGTVLAETRPGDTPVTQLLCYHNILSKSVFLIYSYRHTGHTTAFSLAGPAWCYLALKISRLSSHLLRIQPHLLPGGELLSPVDGQVPPHLVGVLLALGKAEKRPPPAPPLSAPPLRTPRRPAAAAPCSLPGSGPTSGTRR